MNRKFSRYNNDFVSTVVLRENDKDSISLKLTEEEFDILNQNFSNSIEVIGSGEGIYKIKAKNFVGNIVLPYHNVIINPKIGTLNFSYLLAYVYGLDPFRKEDFDYIREEEQTLFERLVNNLLVRIEKLCRRGISKSYYDREENLPCVKGRIMVKENINLNLILKHRVFCRYSDFGSDNIENRIIKYTLHQLSKMPIGSFDIRNKLKLMLHYFEPVSLISSYRFVFPRIIYNRLTRHYEPIINLCRLLLSNSSLHLGTTGEIRFSSFLVNMNELFEKSIVGILYSKFKNKDFKVKGIERKDASYSDEQCRTRILPDIVIRKGRKRLLILDAKYKDYIAEEDLNQIWIYCIALSVPTGILVYPQHVITGDEIRTLREAGVNAIIKSIDFNKKNFGEFQDECSRFADEVEMIVQKIYEH